MLDIDNIFSILWNMIYQVGTWTSALTSLVFTEWFEIPGIASFTIWNMIVNPITFILLMLAVVLKKVVPVV